MLCAANSPLALKVDGATMQNTPHVTDAIALQCLHPPFVYAVNPQPLGLAPNVGPWAGIPNPMQGSLTGYTPNQGGGGVVPGRRHEKEVTALSVAEQSQTTNGHNNMVSQ